MISIQIQKKDLWLLSAIMVFLVGVAFVIAYGSGASPSVMGHSFEEIELPSCSDGEILKKVSGVWSCAVDDSGGASPGQDVYSCPAYMRTYASSNGIENCPTNCKGQLQTSSSCSYKSVSGEICGSTWLTQSCTYVGKLVAP